VERVYAAYGGVFIALSLLWGVAVDGFRPDRYDVIGALVCVAGVADHGRPERELGRLGVSLPDLPQEGVGVHRAALCLRTG
jgi:hypothetical protein